MPRNRPHFVDDPHATDDERNTYFVVMGERGRIVLPAALRHRFNLEPGDRMLVHQGPDGGLRVERVADHVRGLKGAYANLGPGVVDELLQERRLEARRENAGESGGARRSPRSPRVAAKTTSRHKPAAKAATRKRSSR